MKRIDFIFVLLFISACAFGLNFIPMPEGLHDALMGIFSAGIFASIIEYRFLKNENKRLGYIKGKWIREKIYHTDTNGTQTDITQRYLDKGRTTEFELNYDSEGKYYSSIIYEYGTKSVVLYVKKENAVVGTGNYFYSETVDGHPKDDYGVFDFIINNDRIFITHQNTFPYPNAKGIEIWIRVA